MLYFITGNTDKTRMAETHLQPKNIPYTVKSLPLIEIQSNSIEEIAKSKAEQAFMQLQKPLIVSDHGWSIPGLNGFPGPFMKYMNEWLTPQDFLHLTQNLKNRRIILTDVICFKDKAETKIFSSELTGHLIKEIKGDYLPAMTITTFDNNKTVAQYFEESIDPFHNNQTWKEFVEWYETKV